MAGRTLLIHAEQGLANCLRHDRNVHAPMMLHGVKTSVGPGLIAERVHDKHFTGPGHAPQASFDIRFLVAREDQDTERILHETFRCFAPW